MARMGRPRTFDNCLDFDFAAELFFERCADEEVHPTMSGLALALGFGSRSSLVNYEHDYEDEFSSTIKRARARVLDHLEQLMLENRNPAGPIFVSKNMGIESLKDQNSGTTTTVNVAIQALPDNELRARMVRLMQDPDVQAYLEDAGEVLELPDRDGIHTVNGDT